MSITPDDPQASGAPPPDLMTAQEVADRLRIPLSTLYDWRQDRRQGRITGPPGTKLGRHLVFRRGDVEEWLAGRFEPSICPPDAEPPDHAPAAGRYFPWAQIAEAVADAIADELDAPQHERTRIVNAVWAALPAPYQAYMAHLGVGTHADAEDEALRQLRGALGDHLSLAHDTPHPGRTEAG